MGKFVPSYLSDLFLPGKFLRSSFSLLGWMLIRAASQALIVVYSSRLLGSNDYGKFVTVIAVASLISPLAGLGVQGVVLRNGARDQAALPEIVGNALRVWAATCAISCLLAVAILLLLPDEVPLISGVFLAITEIACSSIVEILARSYQAQHRLIGFGAALASLPAAKLLCLFIYAGTASAKLEGWMLSAAAGNILCACALYSLVRKAHAGRCREALLMAKAGLPFALGAASIRVQSEFNKPILSTISFQSAGVFNVAQRATELATIPLLAMQDALWPRIYERADIRLMIFRATILMTGLAFVSGVAIWFIAPLLPTVLGSGFNDSIAMLQWLAWLPAAQVLRNIVCIQTFHAGRSRLLGAAYVLGAITNVLCTVVLVGRFGLSGAAMAAYCTEAVVILTQVGSRAWANDE